MKKALILSPYLSNIGGTEIEAVTTAVLFFKSKKFEKVTIFSEEEINDELHEIFLKDTTVQAQSFPRFFKSKAIKFIDKVTFKFGSKYEISKRMYLKYLVFLYSDFYILSYPKNFLSLMFMKVNHKSKRTIFKITMNYLDKFNSDINMEMQKLKNILVFNNLQRKELEDKYQFKNIYVQDVMIPFENNLLNLETADFSDKKIFFGYLGRISTEKNIIDMIKLMEFLFERNVNLEFKIQGVGDLTYTEEIKQYIKKSPVSAFIKFDNSTLLPHEAVFFYKSIDAFLVTSLHEGGPITALESVAAGKMLFSYNVGAMAERFDSFSYVINSGFHELCENVFAFLNLETHEKNNIVLNLRSHYLNRLSNAHKAENILKLIE